MIHNAAFFVNSEITIVDAKYIQDYIIEITFSDEKINIIDFRKAIMRIKNSDFEIYKDIEEFKMFKFDIYNIFWGYYEMHFNINLLYEKDIENIVDDKPSTSERNKPMTFKELSLLNAELIKQQGPVTYEQAKAQTESAMKAAERSFAKAAPKIQSELKHIQTPLSFSDTVDIYRWLFRKQITIEMLPKNVLNEFIKTKHYQKIIRINENESF